MSTTTPVAMQWSGGKDSAHALGRLLGDERYDVRCLVTAVHGEHDASIVHELPPTVLRAQAEAVGLPLVTVSIPGPGLDGYAEAMGRAGRRLRETGIQSVAFGDLEYSGALTHREELFRPLGLDVVEPLWGLSAAECIEEYLRSRIDAVTVVVDADVLGREHLGVPVDRPFVGSLPPGCDPCGELGEYHTVVRDAPYFRHPVPCAPRGVEHLERQIGTSEGVKIFRYWQLLLGPVEEIQTPRP